MTNKGWYAIKLLTNKQKTKKEMIPEEYPVLHFRKKVNFYRTFD